MQPPCRLLGSNMVLQIRVEGAGFTGKGFGQGLLVKSVAILILVEAQTLLSAFSTRSRTSYQQHFGAALLNSMPDCHRYFAHMHVSAGAIPAHDKTAASGQQSDLRQ